MDEVAIPILRATDAEASAIWSARLGLKARDTHSFAPGLPLYSFLVRGNVQLHLSEHTGDAKAPALVYMYASNLDELAAEFGVGIKNHPWGREIELTDPDQNCWRVGEVGVTPDP